ncbi:MAG: DUF6624 domain-containing protein [Microgenomates group bacterium]
MKYTTIAEELNKMALEDQQAREKFYSQKEPKKETFKNLVVPIDERNYQRIAKIIDQIGYPTISKVGKQASFNAWLIIQHHPQVEFQKKCLQLMENAEDDVNPQNIAYLKDRVLMFSGKKQVYGTQLKQNEITNKMELYNVEDEAHLDDRRKQIGLEPIAEYLKKFE